MFFSRVASKVAETLYSLMLPYEVLREITVERQNVFETANVRLACSVHRNRIVRRKLYLEVIALRGGCWGLSLCSQSVFST